MEVEDSSSSSEMVDYKALYEVQRQENEVGFLFLVILFNFPVQNLVFFPVQDKQRRIVELEAQQRVMEASFRTMFRLHREFEAIRVEAETNNDFHRKSWAEVAGIGLDDDKRTRFESASPTFSSELQERYIQRRRIFRFVCSTIG